MEKTLYNVATFIHLFIIRTIFNAVVARPYHRHRPLGKIGEDEEVWAVNLTDAAESQIHAAEGVADLLEDEEVVLGGAVLLNYPPWIYLVLLAILLSAVEWFLYQRRRID